MTLLRTYEPARTCTGGPTPGAKALMAWFLGKYAHAGGKNLGIYNCRTVRGGTTTSLHGEGRACDFGINPHGASWGTGLAELLRSRSGELGIQCIIWDRRIWSGSYPDEGWRAYSGTNPHVDHIHLELSRSAAASLTPQQIQRALVSSSGAAPVQEDPFMALSDAEQHELLSAVRNLNFQLFSGEGGPNRPGWRTWKGGTDEQMTIVDYLRRNNVEVRQLHVALAGVQQKLDQILTAVRSAGVDPDAVRAAIDTALGGGLQIIGTAVPQAAKPTPKSPAS